MVAVTLVEPRLGDWLQARFPYNAEAVAILKDTVPHAQRRWVAAEKFWMISPTYGEALTEAFLAAGHSVGGVEPVAPAASFTPAPAPTEGGSMWVSSEDKSWCKTRAAEIVADIPAHLRQRTFREIAKLVLPDLYRR